MNRTKKIVILGIFTAIAIALSYIEFLIPMSFIPIPGFKLGLANISIMVALYVFGPVEAIFVSALRLILSLFLFSNIKAFLYSLLGAILSLAVMILLKKINKFKEVGVSVSGAVFHNLGQIMAASFLMNTVEIWGYYPFLVIAGVITGALTGIILHFILRPIKEFLAKNSNL